MEPITIWALSVGAVFIFINGLGISIGKGLNDHYKKCDEDCRRDCLPGWAKDMPPEELARMMQPR